MNACPLEEHPVLLIAESVSSSEKEQVTKKVEPDKTKQDTIRQGESCLFNQLDLLGRQNSTASQSYRNDT